MIQPTYKLKDGTVLEITKVPNDKDGNERYLVFDPTGVYDQFIITPNGKGKSDPMTPSQQAVLAEIKSLFS